MFGFRYLFDRVAGFNFTDSLRADAGHLGYITVSLKRLFSFHGAYEIFSVTGLWILLLIPLGLRKGGLKRVLSTTESYIWWYLPIVLVQMLLSTDISRMLYLSMPFLVIIYAKCIDELAIMQIISAHLPGKRTG
ncbi:MAG: hypothetical protein R2744_02370 [Bacteroidales bacterium]